MGENTPESAVSRRSFCRSALAGLGISTVSGMSRADGEPTGSPAPFGEQIGHDPIVDTWRGTDYVRPMMYRFKGHHTSRADKFDSFYSNDLDKWFHRISVTARSEFGRWNPDWEAEDEAGFAPYLTAQGVDLTFANANTLTPSPGNMDDGYYFGTSRPLDDNANTLDEPNDDKLIEILKFALGQAPAIGDSISYASLAHNLFVDKRSHAGYDYYWPFATGGWGIGNGVEETTYTLAFEVRGDPGSTITGAIETTIWGETNFDGWENEAHSHTWDVTLPCPGPDGGGGIQTADHNDTMTMSVEGQEVEVRVEDTDETIVADGRRITDLKRVTGIPYIIEPTDETQ